jgi:hypothetical protein
VRSIDLDGMPKSAARCIVGQMRPTRCIVGSPTPSGEFRDDGEGVVAAAGGQRRERRTCAVQQGLVSSRRSALSTLLATAWMTSACVSAKARLPSSAHRFKAPATSMQVSEHKAPKEESPNKTSSS